jgi:hypothetical protein
VWEAEGQVAHVLECEWGGGGTVDLCRSVQEFGCTGTPSRAGERPVQILWTSGGYPVEKLSVENNFRRPAERIERTLGLFGRLRADFRLNRGAPRLQWPRSFTRPSPNSRALVQHITETIDGRTYHIEVSRIGADRWRAHLVRVPGVPAAMMPFYGATPEHAAQRLAEWLAGAQRSAQE